MIFGHFAVREEDRRAPGLLLLQCRSIVELLFPLPKKVAAATVRQKSLEGCVCCTSMARSTGPYLKYCQPLRMLRSSMAGCRSHNWDPQLVLHDCFYKGNNLGRVGLIDSQIIIMWYRGKQKMTPEKRKLTENMYTKRYEVQMMPTKYLSLSKFSSVELPSPSPRKNAM